jgi:uncharacterized membrane-anchored protein
LQSETRKGDYFFIASGNGGADMLTTILAWVIAILGFVMIVGGVYSFFDHYAITLGIIGMICGGFAMGGIAQALRLLIAIAHTIQPR